MVSKTKEMNRWKKLTKLVEKRSDLFCEGQKPQDRKKKDYRHENRNAAYI